MDYWLPIIVLFGAFFFMLALGVPIVYAIGLSTLASISTQLDFNSALGNDSNLLIVFYVQIMPDDFVMQLHR
ncbi:hypothetical protein MON98_16510, partial [Escherichia coli]|nr:hypothetical protein [Escherichia coli]